MNFQPFATFRPFRSGDLRSGEVRSYCVCSLAVGCGGRIANTIKQLSMAAEKTHVTVWRYGHILLQISLSRSFMDPGWAPDNGEQPPRTGRLSPMTIIHPLRNGRNVAN